MTDLNRNDVHHSLALGTGKDKQLWPERRSGEDELVRDPGRESNSPVHPYVPLTCMLAILFLMHVMSYV